MYWEEMVCIWSEQKVFYAKEIRDLDEEIQEL
jgi:hypothetical protein